jgi:FtsZ-binding cell division protein ZapB
MDSLETLESRVRQAAEQLAVLKDEKQKLLAEIKFLEEENERTKGLIRENESLRDEKKTVAARIEKVIKKINSLKI